jgi:hypothetical protein
MLTKFMLQNLKKNKNISQKTKIDTTEHNYRHNVNMCGRIIKFGNLPPCACHGSTGQTHKYGLMTFDISVSKLCRGIYFGTVRERTNEHYTLILMSSIRFVY